MTWLSDLVGQYRRRYLRQIANENRIWSARGPQVPGTFELRFDKIYVELRVAPCNEKRASLDILTASGDAGSAPIWDFLQQLEDSGAAPPIVLLGAPGAGKSTLLRHIALTLIAGRAEPHRADIPILLSLREHAAAITGADPPSLGALAERHFSRIAAHAPVPEGWFEKKLRRGRCVALLDGLGEVSPDDRRAGVAAWIDQQIAAYPGAFFIVTSRPAGYRTALLASAIVLEIQPFSASDVDRFVQGWHRENEIMRALGHEDEIILRRAATKSLDLMSLLLRRPALAALSRSPLLLTMLATVHSRRGPLPSRRADLYGEICQVLLGAPLADGAAPSALAALAAHMIQQRIREIGGEEALAVIEPVLARAGVSAGSGLLHEVEVASGLLVERRPGRWAFAHRTFQEYLAAVHLRADGALLEPSSRPSPGLDMATLIEDAWWQEVLLFHAALGDATPTLKACLAWSTVAALTLAGECLEEASEIEPEVRAQVEQRISADAESNDPERRRLTASVWLSRRTAALRPIDGRRAIDARFVTTAEYQLFLDETRLSGELFHPDHWPHHRFQPGTAKDPVRGVRAEDAERFARWLSRRRGGSINYRLPTVEEAKAHPAEDHDLCIAAWCKDGGKYRLVGFSREERAELIEQLRPCSPIPPPPSLSFNLVRILDLARDRDLDLDLAIVIALALSHVIVTDGAAGAEDTARVRELDLGGRLMLAVARIRDRISSRDLARALAHARARARELEFDLDQTMAVALRPAFDLLHDLARNRAHAALDRARDEEEQEKFDRALSLARELGEEDILAAVARSDFLAAHALASVPMAPPLERIRIMLEEVLTALRADGPPELRKEQRLADVWLLERAWEESATDSPEGAEGGAGMARRMMAELSWWIHVILGRREGLLPAWEGIRLVRERPRG